MGNELEEEWFEGIEKERKKEMNKYRFQEGISQECKIRQNFGKVERKLRFEKEDNIETN